MSVVAKRKKRRCLHCRFNDIFFSGVKIGVRPSGTLMMTSYFDPYPLVKRDLLDISRGVETRQYRGSFSSRLEKVSKKAYIVLINIRQFLTDFGSIGVDRCQGSFKSYTTKTS